MVPLCSRLNCRQIPHPLRLPSHIRHSERIRNMLRHTQIHHTDSTQLCETFFPSSCSGELVTDLASISCSANTQKNEQEKLGSSFILPRPSGSSESAMRSPSRGPLRISGVI